MRPVLIATKGWRTQGGEQVGIPGVELQDATLRIDGPLPSGPHKGRLLLTAEVVASEQGGYHVSMNHHVLLPVDLPKALRRLETYSRDQGRLGAEMDSADELRALGVLARTMEQLDPASQRRALRYLQDRYDRPALRIGAPHPVLAVPLSETESLGIARERLLG